MLNFHGIQLFWFCCIQFPRHSCSLGGYLELLRYIVMFLMVMSHLHFIVGLLVVMLNFQGMVVL